MNAKYASYLDGASWMLGLPIRPEHREAVLAALATIMAQAELVLNFPLPESIEAAPRFDPADHA